MLRWRQKQNSWSLIAIVLWLLIVSIVRFTSLIFIRVWLASVTSSLFTRQLLWCWSLALSLRGDGPITCIILYLLRSIWTVRSYHNHHWTLLMSSCNIKSSWSFFQQIFVPIFIVTVFLIQNFIITSFIGLTRRLSLRISVSICFSSNICGRHRFCNSLKIRIILLIRIWLLFADFMLYTKRFWAAFLQLLLILSEWFCVLKNSVIGWTTLSLAKCLLLLATLVTTLGKHGSGVVFVLNLLFWLCLNLYFNYLYFLFTVTIVCWSKIIGSWIHLTIFQLQTYL